MLDEKEFNARLAQIDQCLELGHAGGALEHSQTLRDAVLKQVPVEPNQLGWTRFFIFKSLYSLKNFEEAFDFLKTKESHLFIIETEHAAWMYSTAAEIAARLSQPAEEVTSWGQKCLDLRLASNDLPNVVHCCNNVCTLLGVLHQDEKNEKFSSLLIELGEQYAADRLIIGGLAHMMRNIEASGNSKLTEQLVSKKELYTRAFEGPFRNEASEIFEQFQRLLRAA